MVLPGLLVAGVSFATFRGLHRGLAPLSCPAPARTRWKWRNPCTSLVHSLLAGSGALLGLPWCPQMAVDPIRGHSPAALVLVSASFGYFLADGPDLLRNQTLRQAWELLGHHAPVMSCLGVAVVSGRYVGFAVVSLLLELNSACLHVRQLLLLAGRAPPSAFRLASRASLATLPLLRLAPLGWMSHWLPQQQPDTVPSALRALGGGGLLIVGLRSIVLAVRLLVSDCLRSPPAPPGPRSHRG
uniref:TLC domain containing 2 n=1 Tax=Ornithorhynchus anatinus TaxID=9258 RepID=A0A6I8NXV0_ORNAN